MSFWERDNISGDRSRAVRLNHWDRWERTCPPPHPMSRTE